VEVLIHALAACLTASLVYHAAAKGIRIEGVESSIEGDLDLRGFLGPRQRGRAMPRLRCAPPAVRRARAGPAFWVRIGGKRAEES
jgi:hypothetical protein